MSGAVGLMLFDVDLARGILERGRVAHPLASGGYDSAACRDWWSSGNSVRRSLVLADHVYSIAERWRDLRVQPLDALGRDVATVPLARDCVLDGRTVAHGTHGGRDALGSVIRSGAPLADICACGCLDGTLLCSRVRSEEPCTP
jgi:hypothetical protein